jgi:hypothetical protein
VRRRRFNFLDPTARGGTSDEVLHLLFDSLKKLSERERGIVVHRFGLLDGRPRSLDEIGRAHSISRERVRLILSRALSKLEIDSNRLRVFVGQEIEISDVARIRVFGEYSANLLAPVFCDRHGWTDPGSDPIVGPVRCGGCPCALGVRATGRPRRYCSDACRQSAYRHRQSGRTE